MFFNSFEFIYFRNLLSFTIKFKQLGLIKSINYLQEMIFNLKSLNFFGFLDLVKRHGSIIVN